MLTGVKLCWACAKERPRTPRLSVKLLGDLATRGLDFSVPRLYVLDGGKALAAAVRTKIPGWENASLGTGFQFFNLFNHPNFGFPDNFVSSPTLGQIFYLEQSPTSILGNGLGGDASPRMIQVKAQLQF